MGIKLEGDNRKSVFEGDSNIMAEVREEVRENQGEPVVVRRRNVVRQRVNGNARQGNRILWIILGLALLAVLGWHFLLGSGRPALDRFLANTRQGTWNFATLVGLESQAQADPNAVPMAPIVENIDVVISGQIDWNEDLLLIDFKLEPGLAPNVMVQYAQTGKPNTVPWTFNVPANTTVIVGGYSVSRDGVLRSNGYYAAIPALTRMENLVVTDGFILLVNPAAAKAEFCHRLAQVKAQRIDGKDPWVAQHVDMPADWGTCDEQYSVPVDSGDGGSLPLNATPVPGTIATAVPTQSPTGYAASGCNLRAIVNDVVSSTPLVRAVTGSVTLNSQTPKPLPLDGNTYNWYDVTANGVRGWMANSCLRGAVIVAPAGSTVSQGAAAVSTAICPSGGVGLATGPAILETQVDGVWSVVKLNAGSTYMMPAGACWAMPSQNQLNAEYPGHAETYQAKNAGAPSKEM